MLYLQALLMAGLLGESDLRMEAGVSAVPFWPLFCIISLTTTSHLCQPEFNNLLPSTPRN